jgi:hypothetical protein
VREAGLTDLAPLACALERELAAHATPDGVRMRGGVWLVGASA